LLFLELASPFTSRLNVLVEINVVIGFRALAFTLAIVFFLAFCLDYVSMFVTYDFVSSIRSPIVRSASSPLRFLREDI